MLDVSLYKRNESLSNITIHSLAVDAPAWNKDIVPPSDPRLTHALQVHVVWEPALAGVLFKYALADERKRSEFLTLYAEVLLAKSKGSISTGKPISNHAMLRIELTVMLVLVRTVYTNASTALAVVVSVGAVPPGNFQYDE